MADFNPSEHNVDEVKTHVEENPQDAQDVLDAEKAGNDRSTLVSWLETFVGDQPDVPEPVEPKAVELAPADQTVKPVNVVHGVDYEVTAERGYRVKR